MIRAVNQLPTDPTESASRAAEGEGPPRLRIAFVGQGHATRSRMAHAFAHIVGGDAVEIYSAGRRPTGEVSPRAVESMRRIGYDLPPGPGRSIREIEHLAFDVLITLGRGGDDCPTIQARRREAWEIPDPARLPREQFDQVRDLIGQKVRTLIAGLRSMEM